MGPFERHVGEGSTWQGWGLAPVNGEPLPLHWSPASGHPPLSFSSARPPRSSLRRTLSLAARPARRYI